MAEYAGKSLACTIIAHTNYARSQGSFLWGWGEGGGEGGGGCGVRAPFPPDSLAFPWVMITAIHNILHLKRHGGIKKILFP